MEGDSSQSEECDNIISKTHPEDARADKMIAQGNIALDSDFRLFLFNMPCCLNFKG